mgnify:CR=1 FL=1|tara:strand:+ start:99 stop:3281 length:3183 start_codon:yes stop_codon:yes gene_type:complete
MKTLFYCSIILFVLSVPQSRSQEKEVLTLLQEDFATGLSQDWFWGLGTWKANNGVLRGFESGERRHGPVKLRRLKFTDATIRYEFRLEAKAGFSSFPMNGGQERGHILNVVMSRTQFRIIAHIRKGENIDLVDEKIALQDQQWHPVQIQLQGETIKVDFNGKRWEASHPVVAETKDNFGFAGDSGGAEGEKAGALEFRNFTMTSLPAIPLAKKSPPPADESPCAVMPEKHFSYFEKYCLDCHDTLTEKGSVNLEDLPFDLGTIESAERWQKVLNTINSGEMPPEDKKQPTAQDKTVFLESLSKQLVVARKLLSDTGGEITMRRLNRREYENTIEALLGVNIDSTGLPADANSGGFDTAGASLFFSSDQFEQYLKLARSALDQAIVTGPAQETKIERIEAETEANERVRRILRTYYRDGYSRWVQWKASKGKPATDFGFADEDQAEFKKRNWDQEGLACADYLTREETVNGALLTVHRPNPHVGLAIPDAAPAGKYLVRAKVGITGRPDPTQTFLEVGFRGERIEGQIEAVGVIDCRKVNAHMRHAEVIEFEVELPALEKPLAADAGANTGKKVTPERVIAFRQRQFNSNEAAFAQFLASVQATGFPSEPALWIDWVEWEGPILEEWPPAGHKTLFFGGADREKDEAYARAVIQRFATRAFRGKQPDPEFVDRLVSLYSQERPGNTFEQALKQPLSIVLASPGFLYLREPAPNEDAKRKLSSEELAVRLSYFLWSSPPDEALLAAARKGEWDDEAALVRQAHLMLKDKRAMEFVSSFAHQWLHMERLDFFQFNHELYPEFDDSLKAAARQEVYETILNIIRKEGSVGDLLKSDTIVINDLLGYFYGIENVGGSHFREVKVPETTPRGGLLGMAAILAMGSDGERSSPVERGAWVLRKLLHDPPPPAPANVPQLSRFEADLLPARKLIEAHMEEAQCAQCHRKIDPIGYGLEHFNAVGLWRETELVSGSHGRTKVYPIDDTGTLPNGAKFDGFFELRDRIAEQEEQFARGFVEHLIEYALGRPYGFSDQDLADWMLRHGAERGRSLNSYIRALVISKQFQQK